MMHECALFIPGHAQLLDLAKLSRLLRNKPFCPVLPHTQVCDNPHTTMHHILNIQLINHTWIQTRPKRLNYPWAYYHYYIFIPLKGSSLSNLLEQLQESLSYIMLHLTSLPFHSNLKIWQQGVILTKTMLPTSNFRSQLL